MAATTPTSFRLSPQARANLDRLCEHYSRLSPTPTSRADVIELALADLAYSVLSPKQSTTKEKSKKS